MALDSNREQWPEPIHPWRRTIGAFLLSIANGALITASAEAFSDRALAFLPLAVATLAIHGLEVAHTKLEIKRYKKRFEIPGAPEDHLEENVDRGLGMYRILWAAAPLFTSAGFVALFRAIQ